MELLELHAPDGVTSKSRLFSAGPDAPGMLISPAMGVSARIYDRLGDALQKLGITALVGEYRGGESSSVKPKRGVRYGYAELIDDLVLQRDQLRAHSKGPIHLLGHSIGAHCGVFGLDRWFEAGSRFIIIAAGSLYWRDWPLQQRPSILVRTQAAGLVARTLGYFPGDKLKFGGVQSGQLITEWSNYARTNRVISRTRGPLDQHLDSHAPDVLALHVKGDTFAPRESLEGLLKRMPRARVTREDLEPPAQPTKMDPHFRWMREPASVAEAARRFIAAHT